MRSLVLHMHAVLGFQFPKQSCTGAPTFPRHARGQTMHVCTCCMTLQAAAKQADDDEDIFGDAGTDYKPSVTGKKKAAPAAGGAGAGGGDDMEIEEGEAAGPLPGPPPPPGPPSAEAYAAAYGADPYAAQYGGAAAGGWEQYGAGQYGAAGQAVQQQQQQQEPRWRVRTRKTEERMVDFVDDAYGEYYPMAVSHRSIVDGLCLVTHGGKWG